MRKSVVLSILVLFTGYTVTSYGVVLLHGWNVTFKQWINPLDAYTWPADGADPDPIPPGQLFPGSAATDTAGPFPKVGPAAPKNPGVAATGAPANSVGAAGGGFGR